MTEAADFIDATLQYEASWQRAQEDSERFAGRLHFYGSSVGAVRGTVRDAGRRYPGVTHDEVTALASELWSQPVYERRLAAIVLLQSHSERLVATDLTRLEGFVRTAVLETLVDQLAADVIRPLLANLRGRDRERAGLVLRRWAEGPDELLRRAARPAQ